MALKACDQLWRTWKSNCSFKVKFRRLRACVESFLLYGSEPWTITKGLQKRINGCYTRLLRKAHGWSSKDHKTLAEIIGNILRVSSTIKSRRLQFIGHCVRCSNGNQPVKNLVSGQPPEPLNIGQGNRKTFIKQELEDLPDLNIDEIFSAGRNRELWRELTRTDL